MKVIGLMAGTSLDGVDAALVDLTRTEAGVRVELLSFKTYPYDGETVRFILEAGDEATGYVDKVARLNFYLGEIFAEAALSIIKEARIYPSDVDLIGSHGQTIHHLPMAEQMGKYKIRATLQVAEPSVIAVKTGVTTVADFRPADVAAGGSGAPLVPYVDYLLFSHPRKTRFLVNIGGIANGTVLEAGAVDPSSVVGSDVGPGNMLIDELTARHTNMKETYDRDGRHAAKGKASAKVVSELLESGFFSEPPPKSTGRERFGARFADAFIDVHPASRSGKYLDHIATATALTAQAIFRHYDAFYRQDKPVDEVIISGGGAKNLTLLRLLTELFQPIPVATSDEYGVPALAKEAIAFAILAMETVEGRPANIPGATGADRRVVLGKICPGHTGRLRF